MIGNFEKIIDISPVIRNSTPVFPGDVNFSRQVSMDFPLGHHLALSSMTTTMHIGAHTDAPNHYHAEGRSIDQQDLQYYCGEVQVLDFSDQFREFIDEKCLKQKVINAKRILVKTNSFPHEGPWRNEFSAFAPEAISYLNHCGVITIGIDTPSVDHATSKNLESHQRIYQHNMAILEGVDLRSVQEGRYFLIALPLRIEGADASPVRAVLLQ